MFFNFAKYNKLKQKPKMLIKLDQISDKTSKINYIDKFLVKLKSKNRLLNFIVNFEEKIN